MSYVAGMILLHCGPPDECFKVFCNVLHQEIVMGFYTFDLQEINKTYKVFWKLMRENLPSFHLNLRSDNVSCSTFLFEWILTLYSSSFDISLCTYIWDQTFFFGEHYLIKAAVAICSVVHSKFKAQIAANSIDGLKLLKTAR
jgi:Rab-GTPase-TBC domain